MGKTKGKSRRRGHLVLGILALVLAGVAGSGMLSRWRAAADVVRNRNVVVTVQKDIVYRTVDGIPLHLDLYRADGPSRRPGPGLILIHGGSWRSGSKEQVAEIAEPLAKNGLVVASVNYRLAPDHEFPAQIEDVTAAVRWLRRNAAEYNIDPDRIGAVGFSAGAHLAVLLGVARDRQFLAGDVPDVPASVRAVISVSGPFDFTGFEKDPDHTGLAYWLGGTWRQRPTAYRDASPLRQVTSKAPPMLLIAGTDDTLVPPENDVRLAAALKKSGVPVQTILVKNAGHVLTPTEGKTPEPSYPMVLLSVAEFLNRHLK